MGNVLQPQNVLPARPSAAGAPAAGAEPASAEALGWQLRAALPQMRLHSVSIYDSQANVLWLSEGALGPDEHSLVLEAVETLTAASGRNSCENELEDGRVAAFLAVRAPQGHLVGLVMILADLKSSGEGLADRVMSAPTRTVMQKLAVLMRPAGQRKSEGDPTALVLSLAPADAPVATPEPQAAVTAPAPPLAARAASKKTNHELSARAVNDILEFELSDSPILAPRQSPAATASSPALAQPAPATNGHSRASPADSGTSQVLKQAASAADSRTSQVLKQATPADTSSLRVPAPTAPADTASARALRQNSETGS